MTIYQKAITELAPHANARHVEAFMRLECGTLDALSEERFAYEVAAAAAAAAECPDNVLERIAESFGL
jgi:hypothetical protein